MRIRKISQEGFGGPSESGSPLTRQEINVIGKYADNIIEMGQESGQKIISKIVGQLSLQSQRYLMQLAKEISQLPIDFDSKLKSSIGVTLHVFNEENQKKITNPPEDYNFSKEFGIIEPPVFVTEIEKRKVIDETLDGYNKGEIPKEQMQATLREFAFGKTNWYKEAKLADLTQKPIGFAKKIWEAIGPKALPAREDLMGKIKAFDIGKIVAAIKKWGHRDIGGFPILTEKEVDDVLFALEDSDLAGALETLQT